MGRRITSATFIGREAELEEFVRVRGESGAGRPGHLLVSGEAGVGKTRLVTEAAARASEDGWLVLAGGCVDLGEGSLPFAPYVELLRAWARREGRTQAIALAGTAAGDLGRLVPELRPPGTPVEQHDWMQARIHDALLDVLTRIADRQPLVVILDDLHWADPATLAATAFLLHGIDAAPITIIGTYRSDELHRRHPLRTWLASVGRTARLARMELPPFGVPEMEDLLRGVSGHDPDPDLVASLLSRSDGNPFFAEELLMAGGGDTAEVLSASLRDLLAVRIAAVSDDARALLGAVAVVGRSVDHDLLTAMVAEETLDLDAGLRELVDAGLLLTTSGSSADGYAFRHALVQEAAYDDLLPGDRRRLHRRCATAIEGLASDGLGPGRPVELAYHWRAARDQDRAFPASIAAGDAAMQGFAFSQALAEYEHALAYWEQLADPVDRAGIDRVDLLQRAGTAAYLTSDDRRAVALRQEAVALALDGPDPMRAGVLLAELGRVLWTWGDAEAAVDAHERAVATIPPTPTAERARALAGLGQIHMLNGHYRRSLELCEEAIAMARAVGARQAEGHALNTAGTDLAPIGDCERAVSLLEAALAIAWELQNADDIGRAYNNLGDVLWWCGDLHGARARAQEGIEAATSLGLTSSYGFYLRMGAVHLEYCAGDWMAAGRRLREATARAPTGDGAELYRLCYSLQYRAGTGDPGMEDAWRRAQQLVSRSALGGASGPPVHLGGAEFELWRGRPVAALAVARDGIARVSETDGHLWVVQLARLGMRALADAVASGDQGVDDPRAVMAALQHAAAEARERSGHPAGGHGRHLDAELATMSAETLRLQGSAASEAWSTAAHRWDALGFRYLAAYCRGQLASAAAAEGDRQGAVAALRAAHATALELGARPMQQWLELAGRRLRVALGASATAPSGVAEGAPGDAAEVAGGRPFGLTARESEVLDLVAAGRTNRQIAGELFISESTAGVHVSNILGKLGVSTRTEAAAVARRNGLLDA